MAAKTYTKITDGQVDQDSPITDTLMTALRDNLLSVIGVDNTHSGPTPPTPSAGFFQNIPLAPIFTYRGDESDGSQTFSATANFSKNLYNCTSATINAGVTMTSTEPLLVIRCTGTFTMTSTSTINANDLNNSSNAGGGDGGNGYSSASSSARFGLTGIKSLYGASGDEGLILTSGNGIFGGGKGGDAYDEVNNQFSSGGKGGGCVIIVAETIDFPSGAVIDVSGENGVNGTLSDGGGGGGGMIIFVAKNYTSDAGTKTVTGGTASGSATAGANGWAHSETVSI